MQWSLGSIGLPWPLWLPSHTFLEAHGTRHIFPSQREPRSPEARTQSHRRSQEKPALSAAGSPKKQKHPDARWHSTRITGTFDYLIIDIYLYQYAKIAFHYPFCPDIRKIFPHFKCIILLGLAENKKMCGIKGKQ